MWSVEPEHTREDIVHFVHERLTAIPSLKSMHRDQKHTIAHKVATSANGSFTWADIAIEIIKTEKTVAGMTKILDSLPQTLQEVINKLVATVDMTTKDSRSILAWMLAAQRPLLLGEIKRLFEIDFTTMTYSERFTDIEQDVRHACGGLIDISDGIVRFRSLAIRHHLSHLAASVTDFSNNKDAKFPFHTKEANYDLCLRTLAYVKVVLDRQFHVSTAHLTYNQLTELFDEYGLLEYASRYWLTHFRNSPMYESTGKHKLTGGFKSSFPNSVAHTLIEATCIRSQYPLTEVYELLQLSLNLRKTVLGESNEVVLQSLINIAMIRQHLSVQETNIYFYQAWKLSQTILSYDSDITITCAQSFIDSITTFTTKSTEVEEVLQYIVNIRKQTHGVSHTTTTSYMRRLAEYYVVVKEEAKAATFYREIHEIMVSRYGYHHTETEEIYRRLKTVSKQEDIQRITQERHKSVEKNVSVSDSRRVTSTRDMVQHYEAEQDYAKAEETMVNYWREISEASRTTKDVKVQEQQVDATFQYADFLQRQKRTDEATSILNGLYLELEKNTTFTQSKVGWIERIGSRMKGLGAMAPARSVYSSLWSYYRSSGQQNTKEAQSVAHSLTETATSSVTTSTSTESQEEILREILETSTMMSTTTVDVTTVKTCQQLIAIYSRQEKHEAIVEVCRDTLQRLWPTVLTGRKDVTLPSQFLTESVEIANQLARSYFVQHYVDEASQIYYSVFQGFRSLPKQHTKELLTSGRTLITHYQSIYRHTDALAIYQALYEALVEVYGVSHHQTIDIAYEKADLEHQYRRREAHASYEKIYTSLKGNSEFCHKEGIRAALSLCKLYEKEQKWEQARTIYQVLWHTFIKKGQEYDLGVEFVDQIFDRYLYIIEKKTRADYKTLHGLAAEYRETCIKFYGAESERTLTASMRLAELDEKEEQHKDEAISIYEFVLNTHEKSKKISTAATFATIVTAKRRLAHLYSARGITHDRAQNLYLEEYESAKSKHGYSHNDTIMWLNLLIACYKKRNTPESNKAASTTLQDVSTNIILHEKDSQKLYESSQAIAKIYKSQNMTELNANDFLVELRRHVISGESNVPNLKGKTTDRRAYVFIVGFEETIRGLEGTGQFSVLMSELMSESLLTEAYIKAKKNNAPFDTVFGYGTRLRLFLKSKQRKEATRIEEELVEIFTHKIVGHRQVDKAAIRQFFDIVVTEFGKDQQDVTVLKRVTEAILRSFNENQFQRGLSLAVLADAYMHHYDGFRSQVKIETAFKVCLYLSGHGTRKCADEKLNQSMLHLSRVLLKEVLQAAKAIRLSLTALSIEELNSLVGLLGEQQNYDDLEVRIRYPYPSRRSGLTYRFNSGSCTTSGHHAILNRHGHHPPLSLLGGSSSNVASAWETATLPSTSQKTSATI
jgi:tetratricopeptide (TPR) repeat protein